MTTSIKPLLTATEVAEQLKIPRKRVYKLVQRDELPALHIGRALRFDQADITRWKRRRRGRR